MTEGEVLTLLYHVHMKGVPERIAADRYILPHNGAHGILYQYITCRSRLSVVVGPLKDDNCNCLSSAGKRLAVGYYILLVYATKQRPREARMTRLPEPEPVKTS